MKGIASAALNNLQRSDLIDRRAFLSGTWAARAETLERIRGEIEALK